ncbi:hypothetical protein GCM10018793_39050 [Streptomyces sulfonofaciens]|uniref:Integral membrane protein n=1 Tax=Streptomyces sulfonofaciens TaxID=68272 RepID=A0A919GB92_9ACTN|nr:hypothetical protein [Streptomyces sulfonofaciens]GHH81512.1 hypothetical protein GCM10018793_39050 [Streptomyces sulfonofaciens]
MILEALGSGLLGLALAWAAVRRLTRRLPSRTLVLPTGTAGGLLGAFVTHSALGPGHAMVTLIGAAAVSAALLSLLLRTGRLRPSPSA